VIEPLNEQQKIENEVNRLYQNWQTLLDVMPEMVILVGTDYIVEFMNRSARERFGDMLSRTCTKEFTEIIDAHHRFFSDNDANMVSPSGEKSRFRETVINGSHIEYVTAQFAGYTGEQLVMLILKDVTKNKLHEREIRNFHENIEKILWHKISELRESEKIRQRLSEQINSLKSQLDYTTDSDRMIGNSHAMRELREMIHQVAESDAIILITGESGTGKELVANKIRECSNRADKPFLKINCNSINDSILESDLFGYEKGAFTGANTRKKGKFEIVDRGSIFLDEIGDISPRMQASLLRVLQNGEIIRVGGTEPIKVDVRVIAATNVDLAKAVAEKRFRLDLYYRLNIINIKLPPLRERKEDIVDLVSYFVKYYREAFKKDIDFVPHAIINRLLEHDWPGNVRELENLIQRAVLMAKGKMITEENLFFDQQTRNSHRTDKSDFNIKAKLGTLSLKNILADFESNVIGQALKKSKGNVALASKELKVGKTALYDKMKRYDISAKYIRRRMDDQ